MSERHATPLALVAALLLVAAGPALAALPPAPFAVEVVPTALDVGAPATMRLAPLPGNAGVEAAVDIYVARLPGGPPVPRYLDPTGAWSTRVTPYATNAMSSGSAPIVAAWREAGPAGWITVIVLFLRPGAEPGHRPAWVFAPVLTRVRVRASHTPLWPPPGDLALAGVATAATALVLLLLPRRRRAA